MGDLDRVYNALRKAHAAGDTENAAKLAQYIRSLDTQPQQEQEEVAPSQAEIENMGAVERRLLEVEAVRGNLMDEGIDQLSQTEKALIGISGGMVNAGRGIQDAYYRATGDDDALATLNSTIEGERAGWEALRRRSTVASVAETVGEVVATLPLGGAFGKGAQLGVNTLFKGATAGSRLATTGKVAGVLGNAAVDGAVSAGIVQRGGLDARLDTAADAAKTGALFAGSLAGVGKVGRKVLNRGKSFTSKSAQIADDVAETYGVPVHLEDALENGDNIHKASGWFNDVPLVGTGKKKVLQNKAAQKVVKEQIDGITGTKHIETAESDLQKSIRDSLTETDAYKDDLYFDYHDALRPFGKIPRPKTNAILDELIDVEVAAGKGDKVYLAELRRMRKMPEGDIKILMKQRADIAEKASTGFKGQKLGTSQSAAFGKLRDAMNEDALGFTKGLDDEISSEIIKMHDKALDFYKADYVPFKEKGVLQVAIKNNEPEAILKALNSGDGSVVRTSTAYNALNREGQKRMQSAFLLDAFEKSFRNEVFSPKAFRTQMKKLSKVSGVMFKGEDKQFFDGLMNLLEYTKSSAEHVNAPMNGSRLMIMQLVTAAGSFGAGAGGVGLGFIPAIGGISQFMKVVTQTKTMRRLITASASRTKDTKKMDFILDYLGGALRKDAAMNEVKD